MQKGEKLELQQQQRRRPGLLQERSSHRAAPKQPSAAREPPCRTAPCDYCPPSATWKKRVPLTTGTVAEVEELVVVAVESMQEVCRHTTSATGKFDVWLLLPVLRHSPFLVFKKRRGKFLVCFLTVAISV
mmetsp:Transcript_15464/g.25878  ORF Transcript_15464/g.25878 Transcript_15464/m.25878 type:complete len:130 (-) Transcript_15464:105-494(-)